MTMILSGCNYHLGEHIKSYRAADGGVTRMLFPISQAADNMTLRKLQAKISRLRI